MKRIVFKDGDIYKEYLKYYNKAKVNGHFSVNATAYKYIKLAKMTLFSMDILASSIDCFIICCEYFGTKDPSKWKKAYGLNNRCIIHDLIASRSFIAVENKEPVKTSE